jgi:hypothetical protein
MEKAIVNTRRIAIVFLFNYNPSLTIIFLAVKVFLLNYLFQLISLRTTQFSITNSNTNRTSKLQQNTILVSLGLEEREEAKKMGVKNEYLSPCGMYCSVCSVRAADKNNDLKLKGQLLFSLALHLRI